MSGRAEQERGDEILHVDDRVDDRVALVAQFEGRDALVRLPPRWGHGGGGASQAKGVEHHGQGIAR